MTGRIPDPRLEAGIERLLMSHPSWFKRLSTSRNRSPEHPDHADVRYAAQTIVEAVLRAIDAADEASGVRRVTAQELAEKAELARAEERQRLADAILPDHWQTMQLWGGVQRLACGRCRYGDGVRYLWPCPTRRAITGEPQPEPNSALLSAADSPVGGVS